MGATPADQGEVSRERIGHAIFGSGVQAYQEYDAAVVNLSLTLDAIGNLVSKSDVGSYAYHPTKRRAVVSAGSHSYGYDANGNQSVRDGFAIDYASYNLPTVIRSASGTSTLSYGAARQRYKQIHVKGTTTETTVYAGGLLERLKKGTRTEYRHQIQATPGTVAVYVRRSSGTPSSDTYYLHRDPLGSPERITNASGATVVALSFDAYGQRRDSDWAGPISARDADTLAKVSRRGYTGHEHLDAVGLIHMGGRVYDPLLGRFLSVDPMLDGVGSAQATNGYAYVHNNPLTYTDPSGYERARPQQLRDPGEVPLAVLDQWEREADARSLSLQRLAAQNGGQLPPMCMTMSCTVNRLLQGFGGTRGPAMVSSIRSAPDLRGTSVTAIDVVTGETLELSQGQSGVSTDPAQPTQPGLSSVPRWPDFFSFNVNVAVPNPWTGTLLGATGAVTIDENGDVYVGLGPSVGKTLTVVSGSAAFGWLNQKASPTEGQLNSFLTGHAFNAGAGFWGGITISHSPAMGTTATSLGFFSPQASGGYTYSWHIGELWR